MIRSWFMSFDECCSLKVPKEKATQVNSTIWEPIRQEADSSQWLKCWDDGCKFMLIESQDYVRTLFASPHMLTNNHKQTFNYGPTIFKEQKRVKSSLQSSWVQTGVWTQYISPNHRFISNTASKYSHRVKSDPWGRCLWHSCAGFLTSTSKVLVSCSA